MQLSDGLKRAENMKHGIVSLAGGLLLVASLLAAGRAEAVDYNVSDQVSCESFLSAIGATGSWSGLDLCVINGGTLAATDRLFVSGPIAIRVQTGLFTNLGEIEINCSAPGRGYYGAGTFVNKGTFHILAADNPNNYGTITNEGTFITAVSMYNGGTFTNACGATVTGTITNIPVVYLCLDPAYPFTTDDRKCQDAIARVGGKYFSARHKALSKCRSDLMKGTAIFEDEMKTTPVTESFECKNEFNTAAGITKARQKVRDGLDKKCTDAILGTLQACGATIDALSDATGSNGCLIDSVEGNVDDLFADEYGYGVQP